MEKTRMIKKNTPLIVFGFILLLIATAFFYVKVKKHYTWQSEQIHILQKESESLKEVIAVSNNEIVKLQEKIESYINTNVAYSETAYNYLAIGNSITKHVTCDYWWNEIGMAATKPDKDYYNQVVAYLEENNEEVVSYAYNYAQWEMQSSDRAETFDLIDRYLSDKLDLITIQLGENVYELATFDTDFNELIKHIKEKSPHSEIIIVGDFWINEDRNEIKKKVSNECNVKYVDLTEIIGIEKYQSKIGTIVYDSLGNEHIIEHEGVAKHPSDEGMKYISDSIINIMNND